MSFDKLRNFRLLPLRRNRIESSFQCLLLRIPFLRSYFSELFNPSVFTLYLPTVRFVKRFPPAFGIFPKEKPNSVASRIRFMGEFSLFYAVIKTIYLIS